VSDYADRRPEEALIVVYSTVQHIQDYTMPKAGKGLFSSFPRVSLSLLSLVIVSP
jgi:hypothetical protein